MKLGSVSTGIGGATGGELELAFCLCFGDEDTVVTVVVAVRGRSPAIEDMAAADEEGSFPVNSSFRIRDFRSSSSSQMVDGAVVDMVDSVPSFLDFVVVSVPMFRSVPDS